MEMFKDMFGKIDPGMCRLSMNGNVAVKTGSGFKTYDVKKGRLTNCDQFVFNIGEEFFFLIPTNKLAKGDIILVSGKPRCVIDVEKDLITAINYEDATVEKILPEHHMFMGNCYFYGKIVSMFGKNIMGLFTTTEELINLSYSMMRIIAIGYIIFEITQCLCGIMRGSHAGVFWDG